ncbi:MAG: tRNA (guanosine(37)-N1)-methyltransferase TrmD [Alphaproteobacteria bacterium]|nr:tRNA (guanosine(37)-N1)-methyltransferase TrmD [Alphaproteobacteria bacterium]
MTWSASVLTLFPDMFPGPLGASLAGKALADGRWALESVDIRDFAEDKHRTVDDSPFGGGPGMVMKPDVLARAIDRVRDRGAAARPIHYLSPRGRLFDQGFARRLAALPGVILVCGRFEGIDQRVIEARGIEEVSLGDFVLSGGELAAMALLDAVVRLLPGVIGDAASHAEESFAPGAYADLLEYPHYTRPVEFEGRRVPEELLSGHHEKIRAWRLAQAEATTRERRGDLWSRHVAKQELKKKVTS